MRSLNTLGTAQVARNISLPNQVIAPAPAREIGLEGFRQRNAILDYYFYDLGALTSEEASGLALRYAREGSILRVGQRLRDELARVMAERDKACEERDRALKRCEECHEQLQMAVDDAHALILATTKILAKSVTVSPPKTDFDDGSGGDEEGQERRSLQGLGAQPLGPNPKKAEAEHACWVHRHLMRSPAGEP